MTRSQLMSWIRFVVAALAVATCGFLSSLIPNPYQEYHQPSKRAAETAAPDEPADAYELLLRHTQEQVEVNGIEVDPLWLERYSRLT